MLEGGVVPHSLSDADTFIPSAVEVQQNEIGLFGRDLLEGMSEITTEDQRVLEEKPHERRDDFDVEIVGLNKQNLLRHRGTPWD